MKSKRLKSLGGTVLIMVLTVMLVLIIMLMATLTVVSTASQRIYTKYEENQAYYSARSALDVFTSSMLSDGAYYAYDAAGQRSYNYTDLSVSPAVDKTHPNMKQGAALQLDLYKIRSQNLDGVDLKYAENPLDTNNVFVVDGQTNNNKNYSLSSTDSYTKDGIAYTGLEYIEYDVQFPTLNDGSNSYGKMLDTDINDEDGDGSRTDQIAKIKVEVLDRKLATDPSYTTKQLEDYFGGDTSVITDDTMLMTAIAKGPRNKDYMKIKITSTVKMMDVEGVAIVIFETTEKDAPAGDNAVTATGGYTGGSGAQFNAAGGAASMDAGTSSIGDGNDVSGMMFTVGSFKWVSSCRTELGKGDLVVAMDGIVHSDNPAKVYAKDSDSFVFLGGTSTLNNGGNFGDSVNGVPVIAEKIIKTSDTDLEFCSDVYIETFESQAGNPGKTKVSEGHNMYVKNLVIPSDLFTIGCDGDGKATSVSIDAGELSALRAKFCAGYSIKSGPKWDGTNANIEITATGATVNGVNVSFDSSIDTTGGTPFDISTYSMVEKDGKFYRKYTLPFKIKGSNTVEVPTAQTYFRDYYKDGAFDPNTGDLKLSGGETNPYSDANKANWIITGADLLAEYMELDEKEDGTARTMDEILTKLGDNVQKMSEVETLDLSSGDKYYYFDQGHYNWKTWTAVGSSGRAIIIIPDGVDVDLEGCKIVTENIDGSTSDVKNGTTKAPKVDIYGAHSELKGRTNTMVTAYIMMPTGKVNWEGGNSTSVTHDDGKGKTTTISPVGVVGSILCGEFNESSKTGVLYLDKNSGASSPGEPALSIQASQYVRS